MYPYQTVTITLVTSWLAPPTFTPISKSLGGLCSRERVMLLWNFSPKPTLLTVFQHISFNSKHYSSNTNSDEKIIWKLHIRQSEELAKLFQTIKHYLVQWSKPVYKPYLYWLLLVFPQSIFTHVILQPCDVGRLEIEAKTGRLEWLAKADIPLHQLLKNWHMAMPTSKQLLTWHSWVPPPHTALTPPLGPSIPATIPDTAGWASYVMVNSEFWLSAPGMYLLLNVQILT